MGWTPRQVGDCGLWHFMAARDGYARANGWKSSAGSSVDPLSIPDDVWADMGIEGLS